MTDIDKLLAEREILLHTVLNMGDVSLIKVCVEHGNCLQIHLSLGGAPAKKPKKAKDDPPMIVAHEKDIEFTPDLAADLSNEFGVNIVLIRDAGTGMWICETDGGETSVESKTIRGAIEKIRKALK